MRIGCVCIGCAHQLREQWPAVAVDVGGRLVFLAGLRGRRCAGRRPVAGFDTHDVGHQFARAIGGVRRVRHQVLELREVILHVLVRFTSASSKLDVGRFGHEHEVARGDRTPVDRGADCAETVARALMPFM